MDRQAELQESRARHTEEYFLMLKTVDELLDILADRYGIEPPAEKWFKNKDKYKQELIKEIIKCKFGP
jgi:hypothetical protein